MADATYAYYTVLDELKGVLNDADNAWMSDDWYESKIFEHFITNKQTTYTFSERASYVWTYRNDGRKIWFYDMTFTGIDDSVYVVNCNGSVKDNAKNDTQDTLTILSLIHI